MAAASVYQPLDVRKLSHHRVTQPRKLTSTSQHHLINENNTANSSIFGSRYVQNLLESTISQPISLESRSKKSSHDCGAESDPSSQQQQIIDPHADHLHGGITTTNDHPTSYRVVQRLLPDVSLARHIVDSDDHAFDSFAECCHDLNNNSAPKMSAERRRDHLHLMRRRKSRARLLTIAEIVKLQHFRKFLHRAGVGPHGLIRKVLEVRRLELLHAYDENGIPAAKDGFR